MDERTCSATSGECLRDRLLVMVGEKPGHGYELCDRLQCAAVRTAETVAVYRACGPWSATECWSPAGTSPARPRPPGLFAQPPVGAGAGAGPSRNPGVRRGLTCDHDRVRIDIVVFDGFDEVDVVGPFEVFRDAGAEVRLVTREPQAQVTAAHGLRVVPDATYEPGADILLVPGGGWNTRSDVGAWGEVQRGGWLPLLAGARSTTALPGRGLHRDDAAGPRRPGRPAGGRPPTTSPSTTWPPPGPSWWATGWSTTVTSSPAAGSPAASTWPCGWWNASCPPASPTTSPATWNTTADARSPPDAQVFSPPHR